MSKDAALDIVQSLNGSSWIITESRSESVGILMLFTGVASIKTKVIVKYNLFITYIFDLVVDVNDDINLPLCIGTSIQINAPPICIEVPPPPLSSLPPLELVPSAQIHTFRKNMLWG